jgi:cob(I)alamin adenosyltransferase
MANGKAQQVGRSVSQKTCLNRRLTHGNFADEWLGLCFALEIPDRTGDQGFFLAQKTPHERSGRERRMDATTIELPKWTRGYVQVYTGEGKGKTTAALGLALRAAGNGIRTYIGQFMKKSLSGEIKAIRMLKDFVQIEQFGWNIKCSELLHGLERARNAMFSKKFQIVILDEISTAVSMQMISVDDVLELIAYKPDNVELILTGRNAPEAFISVADVVSEIQEVKHYFRTGVQARAGIEM